MYQGTTHLLTLTLDDVDLDDKTVTVDFKDITGKEFRKAGKQIDVAGNEIAIYFTQDETLQMPPGPMRILVRWIDQYGNAGVADLAYVDVEGIMVKNTIAYGGESE